MKRETVEIQKELFAAKKSARQKYCDLIIGQRGLWPLFKFEMIILLCQNTPGALGLLLRSKLYPRLLKRCGHNVNFGMGIVLRHPHKIEIGDNVVIDDLCVLDAKGFDNTGIRIGSGVFIGRGSIMSCKNGNIVLDDNVNLSLIHI
jgi:serine acetyltransferase